MKPGVPTTVPIIVSPAVSSRELATPKSARCGTPSASNSTLPGLMSRWTTPARCASASALAEGVGQPLDLVGGRRAVPGHPVGEGAAGQVRHDEGDVVAVVHHLEELDDVRVVEAGQHLGLALDALPGPGDVLGRPVERQALERHLGAVVAAAEVDHAHAAPPEAGHPLVAHVTRLGSGAGGDWSSQGGGYRGRND